MTDIIEGVREKMINDEISSFCENPCEETLLTLFSNIETIFSTTKRSFEEFISENFPSSKPGLLIKRLYNEKYDKNLIRMYLNSKRSNFSILEILSSSEKTEYADFIGVTFSKLLERCSRIDLLFIHNSENEEFQVYLEVLKTKI